MAVGDGGRWRWCVVMGGGDCGGVAVGGGGRWGRVTVAMMGGGDGGKWRTTAGDGWWRWQ